jgi:transcriptional regulator with XRE-family HTH domain
MGEELGKRISEMLKKRNMSQKGLAERLGISEVVISRYISGDRDPKPDMIANLATALQTTSDYLLGIDEGEFNLHGVRRIIARNSSNMSQEDKKALIDALFGEE